MYADFDSYSDSIMPFADYRKAWALNYLVKSRLDGMPHGGQMTFTDIEEYLDPQLKPKVAKDVLANLLREEHRAIYTKYIQPVVELALRQERYPDAFKPLGLVSEMLVPRNNQRERIMNVDVQQVSTLMDQWAFAKDDVLTTAETRARNSAVRFMLAEIAARQVPFHREHGRRFLTLLGFETLLSVALALWKQRDSMQPLKKADQPTETLRKMDLAGRPEPLFFDKTIPEVFRSSASTAVARTPEANEGLTAVQTLVATAMRDTIQRIQERAGQEREPLIRLYPSLFSKIAHRLQPGDEKVATRDPETRETFIETLEIWIAEAENIPLTTSHNDALGVIHQGLQSFKDYANYPDAHHFLGDTGGKMATRSWLGNPGKGSQHPRFFMWGADFALEVARSACAVQRLDLENMPSPVSDAREPASLPVCLLTQPYLHSNSGSHRYLLNTAEMRDYLDALALNPNVKTEPVAAIRELAQQAIDSEAAKESARGFVKVWRKLATDLQW